MIEGVMSVSEMTVRDIMIPRAQMDVVSQDDDPREFIRSCSKRGIRAFR
jgi:magnesium and cobalt transporter